MAHCQQFGANGNSPQNCQTGTDLRGLGDWHVRTLSLYDGHQQNKKQVSRSAASRECQLLPGTCRQERKHQSQVEMRSSGSFHRASKMHIHATDAVSRSHQWSGRSNGISNLETSQKLSCLQRRRAPTDVSELNEITRELYFQGKLTWQYADVMSRGANCTNERSRSSTWDCVPSHISTGLRQ